MQLVFDDYAKKIHKRVVYFIADSGSKVYACKWFANENRTIRNVQKRGRAEKSKWNNNNNGMKQNIWCERKELKGK